MPRPSEIAADARALYGPLDQRPSAQEAGDGALWVAPQASHALYQVQSANWVQIGEGTAAPTAPAGVPVLYGPYVVDYTDIPTEAAKMDLWVPAVGDVLLRLFPDWSTLQQFSSGRLIVGQNVNAAGFANFSAWAEVGGVAYSGGGGLDNITTALQGNETDGAGSTIFTTATVFHTTDPVQIQLAQTGGSDPSAGHVELYALIARSVAP